MHFVAFSAISLALLVSVPVFAADKIERDECLPFVTIDTRGSGEPQGPSMAFTGINKELTSKFSGDFAEYNTKYAASWDQQSEAGTLDIINRIKTGLKKCPDQKYVLKGMSQGAAATTTALQRIDVDSDIGQAIASVLLMGNPLHRAGKKSNIDAQGKKSTENVNGMTFLGEGIPKSWDDSGRVLDMCMSGDGVCSGFGLTLQHVMYSFDPEANKVASNFIIKHIQPALEEIKAQRAEKAKRSAHALRMRRSRKVRSV